MPAYLIAMVEVTDPQKYQEYAKGAGVAMQQYGGKFLARGGPSEVLEGNPPGTRFVVAEFANAEAAKKYYHSPEYQAAREHRLGAADFNMVVVEGA